MLFVFKHLNYLKLGDILKESNNRGKSSVSFDKYKLLKIENFEIISYFEDKSKYQRIF